MDRGIQGTWSRETTADPPFNAFLPGPLPEHQALDLTSLADEFGDALYQLGALGRLSETIPETRYFLYFYVRREAVLSSQIEGTQSSLSDLLQYEGAGVLSQAPEDLAEVVCYLRAVKHGQGLLAKGLPISERFLKEVHGKLLKSTRGNDKDPGEFRKTQNRIGGTSFKDALFVPPPAREIARLLHELMRYLNPESQRSRAATLVAAAIAHVQFETIHPFHDGNGRLGRLLIVFVLISAGLLREPLLYLSVFLKQYRSEYYNLLQRVRMSGDWEAWLRFFLLGVSQTAAEAIASADKAVKILARDRTKIRDEVSAKAVPNTLRALEVLRGRPFVQIKDLAKALEVEAHTATSAIERLLVLGIVRELTGRQWGRVFEYTEYLKTFGASPMD
jgi:Fic family protein